MKFKNAQESSDRLRPLHREKSDWSRCKPLQEAASRTSRIGPGVSRQLLKDKLHVKASRWTDDQD